MVNIKTNKLWFVDKTKDNSANIYKKQQFYKKEYGLQTALLVSYFIKWKPIRKDIFFTSPLIYRTVNIVKNQKISLEFNYQITDSTYLINPILKEEFKKQFNIDLVLFDDNIENFITKLKSDLENFNDTLSITNELTAVENWEIIGKNAVGNFNYKKSVLAEDYNTIISKISESIHSILGEQSITDSDVNLKIDLPNSDESQKLAIKKTFETNLVIQGPPGTGKSHTIVELIKENLLQNKKILFVSEKKSALDVVYYKLKTEKLHYLAAYFNSEKSQKKEFYANLNDSIKKCNDSLDFKIESKIINFGLDDYFNIYQTELTEQNQNLGVSLFDLINYLAKNQVELSNGNHSLIVPDYKEWYKYLNQLKELESISKLKFDIKFISNLPFLQFNPIVFSDTEPLQKIDKRLTELEVNLQKVSQTLKKYNLNWGWNDLTKHCLSASVLNLANRSQLAILDPESKKYKSFDNWTKKYELTQNKLKITTKLCDKWEVLPKLSEIDECIDELKQNKVNFWNSIFKQSKHQIVFKGYNGNLPKHLKIESLQNVKRFYELTHTLDELKIKLKHNLNILNPEKDINHLLNLRQKLETLSSNQYLFLLEHSNALALIEDLHQLQTQIQQTQQIVRYVFSNYSINSIDDLISKIQQIKKYSSLYTYYLPEIISASKLPFQLINYIKSSSKSVKEMTDEVVYFNYQKTIKFNSVLKTLDSNELINKFKAVNIQNSVKNTLKTNKIVEKWKNNRKNREVLLSNPNSKLSQSDKKLKQKLKQAKRIIYHELAKKQQHLPIKKLIEDTNYSIFDTQPLWMMNPLSIAESLPCEPEFFDVVIFDEASQIPLEDALPAIYRAKQIVVVGDSKQMPPSQFFSSSTESITLLNQAETVFNSHLLSWHYRSQHPRLMEFSNHHFYNNELSYFPPIVKTNPIENIFITDGIFEDGVNINEAKIVAKTYYNQLKKGIKDIGIIAFSKTQELEIENQIKLLNLPENKQLLIRNLENTQGIEKDNIIISIGYGFNTDGVFRMNFGPINQDFGANRLNVLLTRAKQKLTVVTSIKSTDFKISANKGVTLLQDFLAFSETIKNTNESIPTEFLCKIVDEILKNKGVNYTFYGATNGLAINCFINHKTNSILLVDPSLNVNENSDIVTILSVLSNRFKNLSICLTHNYWTNKARFEKDVITSLS